MDSLPSTVGASRHFQTCSGDSNCIQNTRNVVDASRGILWTSQSSGKSHDGERDGVKEESCLPGDGLGKTQVRPPVYAECQER